MTMESRRGLYGLNDARLATIRDFRPTLEKNIDEVLADFYGFVQRQDGGRAFFKDDAQLEHAKERQRAHWLRLFEASFDEDYQASARTIGQTHQRIGITPEWYCGAYRFVLERLTEIAVRRAGFSKARCAALVATIQAVVLLDIELVLSAYLDRSNETQSEAATDKVANALLDGAIDLSIATNEAAIANGYMLSSIEEVDLRTQAISAAVEEMVTGVTSISESSHSVAASSETSSQAADEGASVVSDAIQTFRDLSGSVGDAAGRIDRMAADSRSIGEIVKTIEEIAEQTNLLALNATIEAARAGEAGKGFAVVANEVKTLSTQTAKATEEIRSRIGALIGDMSGVVDSMAGAKSAVDDGRQVMDSVQSAMATIGEKAKDVSSRMGEISHVLSEQGQAANEVSGGVSDIARRMSTNRERTQTSNVTLSNVGKLVGEQLDMFLGHDVPDKVVRIAKADHVAWKKRLVDMLFDESSLNPDELADHTCCRLGKWYYGEDSKPYRHHPAFGALEEPHREVHAVGIEAARTIKSGDRDRGLELIIAIDEPSRQVMRYLEELRGKAAAAAPDDESAGEAEPEAAAAAG